MKKGSFIAGVIVTLIVFLALGGIFMGFAGSDEIVDTAVKAGASGVEIGLKSVLVGVWNVFGWWLLLVFGFLLLVLVSVVFG